MAKEKREVLGDNVIPNNYRLRFEPDFKNFTFRCDEVVRVSIRKPSKMICMNAAEIKVLEASVVQGSKRLPAKIFYDKARERVLFKVAEAVKGDAEVYIKFTGIHNDKMHGFYRSSYKFKGRTEYLLSTHHEPVDARRTLVCFDEPAMKATFDVTLVVPNDMDGISNMPVIKTTPLGSKKELRFHTTLRMSTYLLYLGVGKFVYKTGNLGKLKLRVVTAPGNIHKADFAMQCCKGALKFYEDYFGIKYPLPKLDLLAIPDFPAGAMENWGAIVFREVSLLLDPKLHSVAEKQRVAEVISHELVHQWFGDLVTMEWWNDLWLNESFADFLAYKAMDHMFPEWQIMVDYITDTTGLVADQYKATHPIDVEVNNPDQIASIFDEISYSKGGAVLHMLEDYVGPESFRKGLHLYLKKHSYSNAGKADLWNAIGTASRSAGQKKNASAFVKVWIENEGYPCISVERKGELVALSQERFFVSSKFNSNFVWPIAVKYVLDGKEGIFVMDKRRAELSLKGKVLKLNVGQTGFYRVKYDEESLTALGAAIKDKKISSVDSWGVLNDLFTLARSSRIKMNEYTDFVKKYCGHLDYPSNALVAGHLGWFHAMFYGSPNESGIKSIEAAYDAVLLERIGWRKKQGEHTHDTLMRSGLLTSLSTLDNKKAIADAKELFARRYSKNIPIDPDLSRYVFVASAWNGDSKTFNEIKDLYGKTSGSEKIRLLQSMAFFRQKPLSSKALQFALSKEVKPQDVFYISGNMASNPEAEDILWKWVSTNWKLLRKRYPPGSHFLHGFVEAFGGANTIKMRNNVKGFFSKKGNYTDEIRIPLAKTVERVEANIAFLEANTKKRA